MRAVVCRALNSAKDTSVETCPSPLLAADSVRISVRSCGVSFANLLVLQGKHQNRSEPPFTPGTEVAGIVLECGPLVVRFKVGDRVVAGVRSGGFASEVLAPESTTFALPEEVDFESAVQFPTIYATAYGALTWCAHLQAGETVLVHGAGGASGLAAIEIAKVLGATVIACASSQEKLTAARLHGADFLINYKEESIHQSVLALTAGRGADVVFDPVGGKSFDESLRCAAPEARVIPMGFASGQIPQLTANIILVKNITIIGIYWGYYMGWGRAALSSVRQKDVRAAFELLLTWATEKKLKPLTHQTYALEDFRLALDALAAGTVIGKITLRP